MRALLLSDSQKPALQLVNAPDPIPEPGEVLVRISHLGLCATDMGFIEWAPNFIAQYETPLPHAIGHEMSGRVIKIGRGVDDALLGARVAVNPHLHCKVCVNCLQGLENMCLDRPILGCHIWGGAAELVRIRAENVYVLPASVELSLGALVEPICVALHAISRLETREDEEICIIGAGTIGTLCALILKAQGRESFLLGVAGDEKRIEFARRSAIRSGISYDGRPTSVIEAAGAESAVRRAITQVRDGGNIVLLGLPHHEIQLDFAMVTFKSLTMTGSRGYTPATWKAAIELLEVSPGTFDGVVGAVFQLEDWNSALEQVQSRAHLKVQLAH